MRALEEVIAFNIPLKNSQMFTFIHFYLSIAFTLTLLISKIGGLNWRKVNSVIVIGIFLGIFPPLIDKIFNPSENIFYG